MEECLGCISLDSIARITTTHHQLAEEPKEIVSGHVLVSWELFGVDSEIQFQLILNGRSSNVQEVNYLEGKLKETPDTKSVGPWNVGPIKMKEIS